MSRILIFRVLNWAVLLAKLAAYTMVICRMILFLSTGVISAGKGTVVKSQKLSTEMLWTVLLPVHEALSHSSEGDGLGSMANLHARLSAFDGGDEDLGGGRLEDSGKSGSIINKLFCWQLATMHFLD
jgi:hypothetical protein